jgi:2'-5' RNA ligase
VRLFVAVDIDDQTRAQLASVRESIQSVVSTARVPPRITWVKEEAAHVTLRFIGETTDATVGIVKQTLERRFDSEPFDVEWQRVGTFPGGRHPRVIWIGSSANSTPLSTLADEVNERLASIVGPGESRPFSPHVTVGRVKEPGGGVDWPQVIAAAHWKPIISRIDHVTLYASRTSPSGATYTALTRASLKPSRRRG